MTDVESAAVYRLFSLDMDGHISSSEVLNATDDRDALMQAEKKQERFGSELWDRDRLIARLGTRTAVPSNR